MNLRIVLLGKTRENYLKLGQDEYLKRLKPMLKLEWVELPDVSIVTAGNPENVKAREAQTILKHLRPDDFVILLDELGEQKTSLEFSVFMSKLSEMKSVVFVVGGVYGTDVTVRERANQFLCLSKMTFTHQMVRLILLEQIYRALMIQSKRAYHY